MSQLLCSRFIEAFSKQHMYFPPRFCRRIYYLGLAKPRERAAANRLGPLQKPARNESGCIISDGQTAPCLISANAAHSKTARAARATAKPNRHEGSCQMGNANVFGAGGASQDS